MQLTPALGWRNVLDPRLCAVLTAGTQNSGSHKVTGGQATENSVTFCNHDSDCCTEIWICSMLHCRCRNFSLTPPPSDPMPLYYTFRSMGLTYHRICWNFCLKSKSLCPTVAHIHNVQSHERGGKFSTVLCDGGRLRKAAIAQREGGARVVHTTT